MIAAVIIYSIHLFKYSRSIETSIIEFAAGIRVFHFQL